MSREWGEMAADFQGEPRKVFINFLIWNIKQIEDKIYFQHRLSTAIIPLMGLIDSLDAKSKEGLKGQYAKLEGMSRGKVGLDYGDVEAIYREALSYLHETYLKEVRFAMPKYPHGKLEVPK